MRSLLPLVLYAVVLQAQSIPAPVWSTQCGSAADHDYSTAPATATAMGPPSVRVGTFTYRAAVPDGVYRLDFAFTDAYRTAPNQRLFDVAVNGLKVLANFDIFATAGGLNREVRKTFTVTASGGAGLAIAFTPIPSNPYSGCTGWMPCPALCSSIAVTPAAAALAPQFAVGPLAQLPATCPAGVTLEFYAATDVHTLYFCTAGAGWVGLMPFVPVLPAPVKPAAVTLGTLAAGRCAAQSPAWHLALDGKAMVSEPTANCILP